MYEQRDFSEHTAQVVDEEVGRILSAAAERADVLLEENRKKLDTLSEELIAREMLDDSEVESVIGPSAPRRSTLQTDAT